MCKACENIITNARVVDPTRTTTLRNMFAREMRKRFNELISVIIQAVVDQNALGLGLVTQQMTPPGPLAFNFPLDADKLEAFIEWLNRQINRGILEIGQIPTIGGLRPEAWTNKYILDSYKKGVIRARYELQQAGFNVPSIEQSGGIAVVMAGPVHVNKLELLYTRAFSDLKGITDQMESYISRVLAQGLADGDSPRVIARKLVAVIKDAGAGDLGITDTLGRFIPARRRAETLARTEIIRAHHTATMQEYENWGVQGFQVKAEFRTAGDDRVCPDCEALEGNIYTLEEARGLIPVHPMCRCIMLPVKVN